MTVVRCLPIGKRRSLASSFASNCCWRRSKKKPTRRGISCSQPQRPSRQPQRWAQPEGHWAGVCRCSSVQGALPRFVDRRPANLKQAWLKLARMVSPFWALVRRKRDVGAAISIGDRILVGSGSVAAEFRLAPSFVVRPPASKHFDRQRSGGQIAGEAFARPTDCARSAPVES
jgi:hypothetical protein